MGEFLKGREDRARRQVPQLECLIAAGGEGPLPIGQHYGSTGCRQKLEILAVSYDRIVSRRSPSRRGRVDTRCGHVAAASLTLA